MIAEVYNKTNRNILDLKEKIINFFLFIKEDKKINIIFINNSEMQKMNYYYLQKNYPTDILTFESNNNDDYLGDIFISLTKSIEQARKLKKTLEEEIIFLSLHGYLHLKGYNDNTEESFQKMIKLQEDILIKYNNELI
ncbi:MAG: rRNA maturation RNase YbeY [Candidatus Phytoplasma stylosanthis]|uniref:rRNA maturation RNase YbeY n=1 Tax=Candidatus Phytoplasma stylosanthis TaxID=2798314 RepID=UPI0029396E9C|nr:rRNA maturation RNase YbeY [Candidatus Phytoplasma stylosanthis]MDV3167957.1 rRNA maturation RNase YbeY [Candidatus Phytoplasma stylosanthis]MDV3171049.1 rRNA maturation RNase YbeY [Candidatus Phytoplasma stylosanthis]MDV3173662.1 rRNA maturation RNase YbeY [Candidatus Phytoplasma stylosanthis]MDV3174229.1 rRNA maturation RNase YbeY [Candidatus Phytoplasma stylosanthis]MDV3202714.1 rRNA maturation RNase YbeY [Candidatus Phytoplasma stylosanthis]